MQKFTRNGVSVKVDFFRTISDRKQGNENRSV